MKHCAAFRAESASGELTAMHRPSDHYIALRPDDLVRKLGDEPSVTIFEREQFHRFAAQLRRTIHEQYHERLLRLQEDYAPFDPDAEEAAQYALADDEREERSQAMFADFDELLLRA